MSSIASNHDLSSLCYRRIQHTDNLPLIIGIGVGRSSVSSIASNHDLSSHVTGGFSIQTIYH